MILYVDSQFASPYAMSAFVALSVKMAEFKTVALDLAAGQASTAQYNAHSLTSRVPTLVDGDFSISESSAIAEYLDEQYSGERLFPADIRERARARQVQAWLRSDLSALKRDRTTEVVFYQPSKNPLSAAGVEAASKLIRAADTLLLPGYEHIFSRWCIADVDLAMMLNRLVLNGDPVPKRLSEYANRQWQNSAIQAWLSKPRPPLSSA